jgi:hypothetical protein
MSYQKLVEDVFGEQREVIAESEFIAMLPRLMESSIPRLVGADSSEPWPSDRLARVLILRYGLAGEQPHTFRETGEILGRDVNRSPYTQSRMRQVISKAIRMLRRPNLVSLWASTFSQKGILWGLEEAIMAIENAQKALDKMSLKDAIYLIHVAQGRLKCAEEPLAERLEKMKTSVLLAGSNDLM